jgi:hypothetical protein
MVSRSSLALTLAMAYRRRMREQCPLSVFSANAMILSASGGGEFWKYSKDMARKMASRVLVSSLGT